MHIDYVKVLHSPFACSFYIAELLKGHPGEDERALARKLGILGPMVGFTTNSPDTLHKPFPTLSFSLPIFTMSN